MFPFMLFIGGVLDEVIVYAISLIVVVKRDGVYHLVECVSLGGCSNGVIH